jgi:hypothetical protein
MDTSSLMREAALNATRAKHEAIEFFLETNQRFFYERGTLKRFRKRIMRIMRCESL